MKKGKSSAKSGHNIENGTSHEAPLEEVMKKGLPRLRIIILD